MLVTYTNSLFLFSIKYLACLNLNFTPTSHDVNNKDPEEYGSLPLTIHEKYNKKRKN